MFKTVKIEGFRGIQSLEIADLQRVNVFVGANNSGKTTILESIFTLTSPTKPQVLLHLNQARGVNTAKDLLKLYFYQLDMDSKITLTAEIVGDREERRSLVIRPGADSSNSNRNNQTGFYGPSGGKTNSRGKGFFGSEHEVWSREEKDAVSFYYAVKRCGQSADAFHSYLEVEESGEVEFFEDFLYHEWIGSSFRQSKSLLKDIINDFNRVLMNKQVNRVVKILQQIEPSLEQLFLGSDDVIYCDIGLQRLIPINVMGDGLIRILSIILSVSDVQGGVLLVDEIENGLYYETQELLWEVVFEAAHEFNVQVFVTTHSIECLRALNHVYARLNPEDEFRLYRVEKKKEKCYVVSYNQETLDAALEQGWEVR